MFRTGTVTELLSERKGLQRCSVLIDGAVARAYCLTDLVGTVSVGDEVVCNTTAVELGLGTGGWHVVHWNLSRNSLELPGPDHIMKLRYTSLQFDAGTSELVHSDLPDHLGGLPVVVCQLHSQMAVVATVLASMRPDARIVYLMTDGASLPLAMSDLVADLRSNGTLSATVTAGHAFGGDLEAVSVHSGLALAAGPAAADVVIVSMGPGMVGTGTRLGTSAVEAAGLLDTVRALGGRPVFCVRASDADRRERHRGVSHHSETALELTTAVPLVGAHPVGVAEFVDADTPPRAELVEVAVPPVAEILSASGIRITTMGRDVEQDPLFFETAAVAAVVASGLLDGA